MSFGGHGFFDLLGLDMETAEPCFDIPARLASLSSVGVLGGRTVLEESTGLTRFFPTQVHADFDATTRALRATAIFRLPRPTSGSLAVSQPFQECRGGPHTINNNVLVQLHHNSVTSHANSGLEMRPFLLFVCHPLTGHFTPVVKIASGLRERAWEVGFLGSDFFRSRIEAAGHEFFGLENEANIGDDDLFDRGPILRSGVSHPVPSITDSRHQTLYAIPAQWESLKGALLALTTRNAARQIIVVSEAFFYGFLPMKLGAPLPVGVTAPRSVCLSITAPAIRSIDLPPFGFASPFDQSEGGRKKNLQIWKDWEERAAPVTDILDRKLIESGATTPLKQPFMSGANYTCHDAILQTGLPDFEYPRSDFPSTFRIVGIIPPGKPTPRDDLAWWHELTSNSSLEPTDSRRKRVVVVAQGTVETEPTELIIPTLELLAGRSDVLSVAILGSRGARLSPGVLIPANARVVDYLNYDAVLPHADLWVHNGGYGATMHGISHGVPMVIAGEGQDKPENGRRVAWSGLGIDLESARPGRENLALAIDEVLANSRYREVAERMKRTSELMDCFGNIEQEILKLVE